MKLIDADNFISNFRLLLNKSFLGETTPNDYISVGEIAELIKNEPTYYDANEIINVLVEEGLGKRTEIHGKVYISLDDVIKIIKNRYIKKN